MKPIALVLIVALTVLSASAQIDTKKYNQNLQTSFDEYKKSSEEDFKKYQEESQKIFNDFKSESEKAFREYKKRINEGFANMLKEDWTEFKTKEETSPIKSPEKPPVFVKEEVETDEEIEEIIEPAVIVTAEDNKSTPAFIPDNETISDIRLKQSTFSFYGSKISIDYDAILVKRSVPGTGEIAFDALWNEMATAAYFPTLKNLLDASRALQLNDWGYFQLVKAFSGSVTDNKNQQVILSWFLLNQSKYLTKIARTENELGLLIPTSHKVYGVYYTSIDKINYYLFGLKAESFYTYENNFSEAYKVYNLNISTPPAFTFNKFEKELVLTTPKSTHQITAETNKNLIEFYKDYPHTELVVYFNGVASSELFLSVIPELRVHLAPFSLVEKLNILQTFLQKNFEYQIDDEQFGHEKVCFPDEMFYYPYSDCEDRSMLYTWFVRETLFKNVVGIEFPGHVACAIHLNEKTEGNYINIDGEQYIVSDPSYINSPIGYIIPGYQLTESSLIAVQSPEIKQSEAAFRNLLASAGFNVSNAQKSMVYNPSDKSFYAFGSYNQPITLSNTKLVNTDTLFQTAIVKANDKGEVLWAKPVGNSNTNNNALCIIRSNNKLVTTTGISINNNVTYNMAAFSLKGEKQWEQALFADTVLQTEFDHFSAYVAKTGEVQWTEFNEAGENHPSLTIIEDSNGYYCSYPLQSFQQKNIDSTSFASMGVADPAGYLLNEFNSLASSQYERSIAGIFALTNVLQTNGNYLTGLQIKQAVDKANPSFKSDNKDIYNGFTQISMIKNENNRLVIYTTTGSKIRIGSVQIDNKSRMQIVRYKSGNLRMNVEGGIEVVKMMAFAINYATLKQEGAVVFNVKEKDYDFKVRPEIIK